jgi:hypothetical protein
MNPKMIAPLLLFESIPTKFIGTWTGTTRAITVSQGKSIRRPAKLEMWIEKKKVTVKRWFPDGKDYEIYTSSDLENRKPSFQNNSIKFFYMGISSKDVAASEAGEFEIKHLKIKKGVLMGSIYEQPFSVKQSKK